MLELGCAPAASKGDYRPVEGKAADEKLSALCKALAHPVRVRILRILLDRRCICGDLVNALPFAQSTVSEHLRILKEADLVHDEVDGPRRCYCINPQALAQLKRLIAAL